MSAPLFRAALGVLRVLGHTLGGSAPLGTTQVFSPRARISHRIDVRSHLPAKRAALAAHASQRRAEGQVRVLDRLLGLPGPLFALVFGQEWFVEQGRAPRPVRSDIFDSVQPRGAEEVPDRGPGTSRE